jgi:hypothetical protein
VSGPSYDIFEVELRGVLQINKMTLSQVPLFLQVDHQDGDGGRSDTGNS